VALAALTLTGACEWTGPDRENAPAARPTPQSLTVSRLVLLAARDLQSPSQRHPKRPQEDVQDADSRMSESHWTTHCSAVARARALGVVGRRTLLSYGKVSVYCSGDSAGRWKGCTTGSTQLSSIGTTHRSPTTISVCDIVASSLPLHATNHHPTCRARASRRV